MPVITNTLILRSFSGHTVLTEGGRSGCSFNSTQAGESTVGDLHENLMTRKATLRHVKDLRTTLNDLLVMSEKTINDLQADLQPLVLEHGMKSIPDDVLSLIFHHYVNLGRSTSGVNPVIISHVCRRFRSLALGLPELWATLPLGPDLDKFQVYLSRSRQSGLTVNLRQKHCESHLQALAALSQRWTKFSTDVNKRWERELEETFGSLQLHCLESLVLSFEIGEIATKSFYSEWSMPRLRHLCAYFGLPVLPAIPSLTSCTLFFDCSFLTHKLNLVCLPKFLQSIPSLERLSLVLANVHLSSFDIHPERVVLYNLQSVYLSIFDEVEIADIQSLLDSLTFPNVTKFEVELQVQPNGSCLSEWVDCLFQHTFDIVQRRPNLRFPKLKDVSFSFRRKEEEAEMSTLHRLFDERLHLQHIAIDAPNVVSPAYNEDDMFCDLKTLTLMRCDKFDEEFIDFLHGPDGPPPLERISIAGCPQLKEADLRRTFPNASIHWSADAPMADIDFC
ncbi:hypothetical protein DFH11DRAFT_1217804 [Phellopilus nigrolimitatus]|nr:hypothetical protein DFH11DRAFT_1217804 [Phellopilus nigrolimitatus]